MRIGVVGAGSWGTALARALSDREHEVVLWAREPSLARQIREQHENGRYLAGIALPESLSATDDLEEAVRGKELVVAVVPSQVMRGVMQRASAFLEPDAVVVSASKGIERGTLETMDAVLAEVLPPAHAARAVFLSGPSFAREVGKRLPTAVVVASNDPAAARFAQSAWNSDRFRVYTSGDVPGVEIGGAVKNVMAIAAGIADGLGFGSNTRAALITRGLAEITRLAVRRGGNPLTLSGLAGMGDLVLTCTGDLSRNRSVGIKLGQGQSLAEILAGMEQVAEGVETTRSTRDLGRKLDVELPITEMVHAVLYENKPAAAAVVELMNRPSKSEMG